METSIAIIIKKELPIGLTGNICACLATGIMNLNNQIIGHDIVAEDITYKAITKVPIVVLNENKLGINEVIRRAKRNKLEFVLYDRHAVGASDYNGYETDIKSTPEEAREILGVGLIGEQKSVRNVIGDLPLLK
ncbi:DUF2000 domain-containing protein [Candidatus Woesearchaeota archaeon]|nr:DUF2000 domain-containing protein [Candidatus Woesearchaeota archaeon]